MQQGTEEWLNARVGKVTGSRIGALLGVHPYQTRNQLMAEMLEEARGRRKDLSTIPAVKWGSEKESVAVKQLEFIIGRDIEECPLIDFGDRIATSPDGLCGRMAVEIKAPYGLRDAPEPDFKSITELPHYYAQCQFHMQGLDVDSCIFFQWTPHGEQLEFVERSDAWFDDALPKIEAFLAEFDRNLAGGFDEVEEQIIAIKARQERDASELNALKAMLPENYRGNLVSCMTVKKAGAVDYARVVKENCLDIDLEQYRKKPTETRVLRVLTGDENDG